MGADVRQGAGAQPPEQPRRLKVADKMRRAKFERCQSQMILVHNFCDLPVEDALEVAEYCSETIGKMPEGSVLALTVVDRSADLFDDAINVQFCKVFERNRSRVKASAFVCPEGKLRRMFQKAAADAERDNVRFFDSVDEAREWLVNY